jgi:broad specificity phosphatase PhoE
MLPARSLILVKHSQPALEPDVPAAQWHLSAEGERRCGPLADALAPYAPATLVASTEPKAQETTALIAARLNLSWRAAPGLHEHDRAGVGWLPQGELEQQIAAFFAQPDELVFGQETAAAARLRFQAAVADVLAQTGQGTVVIVAHGTVITLFTAAHTGLPPLPLWHRLGLPSFVVLTVPDLRLVTMVEQVGAAG